MPSPTYAYAGGYNVTFNTPIPITPPIRAATGDGFYWETRGVRDARLNWKYWDLKTQSCMHRVHGWTTFERRVDYNTWDVHILRMVIS